MMPRKTVAKAKLPRKGERPIFGVHALPPEAAASAPAWRPEMEAQKQARFLRETRAAVRGYQLDKDAPDEEATA